MNIIRDKFTPLTITKQRRFQLRKIELGLCTQRGEPSSIIGYCEFHRQQRNQRRRKSA